MKNLQIAIQKSGRLSEKCLELLGSILDFATSKNQLVAKCSNFPLEILFLRDDDIPEYVQDGVCDLGIVGENVILEKQAQVTVLEKLGFAKCRLSVAIPNNSNIRTVADLNNKRIATSYPGIVRQFLQDQKLNAKIATINGSVEIAPSLDLSDAIVDIVSTGNTLRMNGLRELATIFTSQAVLIQNQQVDDDKQKHIERLLLRIHSVMQAKKSKYIMMNAKRTDLPNIQQILPALNSPTIVPLASDEMIAIHTVIEEQVFWDVLEKLKAAGASGIVVVPIEKMIM